MFLFVFCLFLFVCFCTVADLSAAEKAMGVKFCMHVGLLSGRSGQVFSPFGEHWLAGSHGGGGISSGMTVSAAAAFMWMCNKYSELATMAHGQLELGAAALLNAVGYGGLCVLQAC